jgi:hypothetical protein
LLYLCLYEWGLYRVRLSLAALGLMPAGNRAGIVGEVFPLD